VQDENNKIGGISSEGGVTNFEVTRSTITTITANTIWTHSYAGSPKQSERTIRDNTITTAGRDAIPIGHATRIRVTSPGDVS
jgi:hypothetical protein